MSEKIMMSGNEAIARGVWEAGVHVAAAYPGTPSTEILENIGALYKDDIYCEWSVNEKVAFEVASGASIGGARAFCAFKHVGMNVATDPIFSMGYAGVNGGLVFVTADDPGCWSSQNEQDNLWYAPHSKIAMLEPSDSQECLDFVKAAYELSERFDTPVMIRMTTRVCHSKSLVQTGDRKDVDVIRYKRNPSKFALLPATALSRHPIREQLLADMEDYGHDCPFNRVEETENSSVGVITSGISYQHAREAFGQSAAFLKLGLTYPLPKRLIKEFCERHETVYVIEENDPYLEHRSRLSVSRMYTARTSFQYAMNLTPLSFAESFSTKSRKKHTMWKLKHLRVLPLCARDVRTAGSSTPLLRLWTGSSLQVISDATDWGHRRHSTDSVSLCVWAPVSPHS